MPVDKVIVFDDLRRYEKQLNIPLVHCTTNEEFIEELNNSKNLTLQILLDHDLGGVAYGPETAREGFNYMIMMHTAGVITIDNVIIITGNYAGYQWFKSTLEKYYITHEYDPMGIKIGMFAPPGFGAQ